MEWYHLPIADMGVPHSEFEQQWTRVGAELHRRLHGGETIVVHCLAGLGRTGLVAARVLVEAGMDADDAVAAIRRARPGTIQTSEQERHVHVLAAEITGRRPL
jgi:ADP-ribosyl-[dinitrogen reductase] hydrolase